jgi:hypothetical protein
MRRFIFGLPAMKELNMYIQPSTDLVLIADIPSSCESQPRRVSCLLIDLSKMQKILAKAARNKQIERYFFLMSIHFAESIRCWSLFNRTLVPNWSHNFKRLSLHLLMSPKNRKGYLLTEGTLIIQFVLLLILSVKT